MKRLCLIVVAEGLVQRGDAAQMGNDDSTSALLETTPLEEIQHRWIEANEHWQSGVAASRMALDDFCNEQSAANRANSMAAEHCERIAKARWNDVGVELLRFRFSQGKSLPIRWHTDDQTVEAACTGRSLI